MSSSYCVVQIVRRPIGPGPDEVRDGWIGLTVPVHRATVRQECRDDLSGTSYGVHEVVLSPSNLAFNVLRAMNPESFAWYQKHGYVGIPVSDFMFNIESVDPDPDLVRVAA